MKKSDLIENLENILFELKMNDQIEDINIMPILESEFMYSKIKLILKNSTLYIK